MTSALAVEATLAILSFGLPTFLMGMLFSALVDRARDAGLGLGRSLAVNTLGAAAAPLLFGAWLAPRFGPQHALVLVGAGYLVLISRRAWSRPPAALLALAMVVAAWWLPPLAFVDVPEGGRIVSYQEGALAAVSVVEDATGVSRLRIDNRQQEGSSASGLADGRQALLPLLFHPAPHRALFLGLGTGVTASAAAVDPGLAVDAVELLPEVIAASAQFIDTGPAGHALPEAALAHAADAKPNLRLVNADARRFVRSSEAFYDVIVADNFHPARSGSGSLYTVEHFQAVDARLAPGGIFCQWLPLHQLDLETLQSIVASFLAVHPDAWAVLATQSLETPVLGLMARRGGGRLDLSGLRARLAASAVRQQLVALGLDDDYAVPGSVVAGRKALTRFAAGAPLNTDDRPVVAYLAPRITYEPDSLPRDRLLVLVPRLGTEPGELLAEGAEPGWSARLAAYWSARDRFLLAGRDVRPSADVRTMLAQVREPLLAVLRISPEFRPAYEPLARMADALAPIDPAGARELRDRLEIVRQARDADRSAVPSVVRAP